MVSSLKPDYVFEVSFEAANKIGGIYTVLRSKADKMSSYYKDGYTLIGPFNPNSAATEFHVRKPSSKTRTVFKNLEKEGIKCHYGKWLVRGKPRTILIDYYDLMYKANDLKTWLWEEYQVDSWGSGYDFDEPVVWSWCAGRVMEELYKTYKSKMIGHFHEWIAGAGLLHLKSSKVKVGTVFTTHATVLGRAAAASNIEIKDIRHPDETALEMGVQAKHLLEKATATHADVFSTVSETTGIEAKKLLGRKPDVLVLNGLNFDSFPSVEEFSIKHVKYRDDIKDFLIPYFFPYAGSNKINMKDALIFFISGRNEFNAKGLDLYIESLGLLNKKMKKVNSKKDVFAFIFVPDAVTGVPVNLLQSITLYQEIKNDVDDASKKIGKKLLAEIVNTRIPKSHGLLDDAFLYEAKKDIQSFKKRGKAPLSAFMVYDDNYIVKVLRQNGLENQPGDKVHVVFYPAYLSPADGLLSLSYYEAIMGSHFGVFPSFYDPWGYTPLETAACGVSAVTSDMTGYGKFILDQSDGKKGLFVMKREGRSHAASVKELSDLMYKYTKFTKKERIENKIEAKRLALLADWNELIKNYWEAHELALK
ncbi:hypothetical protein K8R43_00425 [archaeon]|nr:hypothetical protein [archaeon]